MASYLTGGYWVRGYAEGDYISVGVAPAASASAVVAPVCLTHPAFPITALTATTFSPYRVRLSASSVAGSSDADAHAGRNRFIGFVSAAESDLLASASQVITANGLQVAANGAMLISGRLKWESEPEPGDTWTSRPEASGIWTDRPEPGDTWSNY
jgi:hypothetical protein